MEPKLVTVDTFWTAEEAYAFKNYLEAEGIRTYLADEATVGMLWHYGNAVGGLKVQIADADVNRFRELLAKERPSEDELLAQSQSDVPAESPECVEEEDRLSSAPAQDESETATVTPVAGDDAVDLPGDLQAARALRAAVIGFFVCPPFLHVYSLWLLLRLGLSDLPIGPKGRTKQFFAFVLDAIVLLVVVYVIGRVGQW